MKENAKKIIEDSLNSHNDVVVVDAKADLEILANDPKGCSELNKQIVDFARDISINEQYGINPLKVYTDNISMIPEAFSKCNGLGVSSFICSQSIEDLSINFDEADSLIGPDDKTKEAYKSRVILKQDV